MAESGVWILARIVCTHINIDVNFWRCFLFLRYITVKEVTFIANVYSRHLLKVICQIFSSQLLRRDYLSWELCNYEIRKFGFHLFPTTMDRNQALIYILCLLYVLHCAPLLSSQEKMFPKEACIIALFSVKGRKFLFIFTSHFSFSV